MPKVTFLPENRVVECEAGTTVFAAARSVGLVVETACGGKGTCGLCRVTIVSGGEHLPPKTFEETRFIGTMAGLRLSCRIAPAGDVAVKIPPARPKRDKKPMPPPAVTATREPAVAGIAAVKSDGPEQEKG